MTYLLALSSLLSRLLGIVRHNRFADIFGASDVTDAYFAAFQIPDLVYSIIIYGALSAAFVPLFVEYIGNKGDRMIMGNREMWEFASAVLTLLMSTIVVLVIALFFLSPYLIHVLYPGFDTETQATTVTLMRIMLLSPLFFGFSAIFSGIQTAFRHFIFYAIAPVLYNLAIIFGIVYLSPIYGIYGVAYGVVGGAFLHALIQLPIVMKFGFRPHPVFAWFREDMRKLIKLAIPRVMGIALLQVNLLVEGLIASFGVAGGLTVLRYAQDLQSFPIGIIGLSVAVSSFSTLSGLALVEDGKKLFTEHLSKRIGEILFLIVPSSIGLFLLREPLVRIILKSGAFTEWDAIVTSRILGILCFSLFAASLIPLISRAFYALKNTYTPLVLGIITLIVNASLSFTLAPKIGVTGLAIANAVAVVLNLLLLYIFLRQNLKGVRIYSLKDFSRVFIPSAGMTLLIFGIQKLYSIPYDFLPLITYIVVVCGIGALAYFALAFAIKAPEISENVLLRKIFGKNPKGF